MSGRLLRYFTKAWSTWAREELSGKIVGAGLLEKKGGRIGFFGNVEVVERLGGLKEPVKPFELINGVGKG